ncbi:MAG: extracellular solute-binding protein [Desulfitobacteriaceae bacterium]
MSTSTAPEDGERTIGTMTMDKKLYGVPIVTELEILYYRKDILEQNKIAVPKTIDELLAAAKKVNDPSEKLRPVNPDNDRNFCVAEIY